MADQTTETVNQQKQETITKQKSSERVEELNIIVVKRKNVSI